MSYTAATATATVIQTFKDAVERAIHDQDFQEVPTHSMKFKIVNTSEIEVVTTPADRSHAEFMEDVRTRLSRIPGVDVEVGQPISHRIDHMLSGTRAQIAIKLFGPDLNVLRTKAKEIETQMQGIEGVVDLLVEPQVGVPQIQVRVDRQAAAAVGLSAEDIAE